MNIFLQIPQGCFLGFVTPPLSSFPFSTRLDWQTVEIPGPVLYLSVNGGLANFDPKTLGILVTIVHQEFNSGLDGLDDSVVDLSLVLEPN